MSIGCGSGSSVKPSMVTLSSISMTFSYNLSSLLTDKSNRFGLAWFPITKRSTKPFVIKSATRSPFRSNNALFYINLYSFAGMGGKVTLLLPLYPYEWTLRCSSLEAYPSVSKSQKQALVSCAHLLLVHLDIDRDKRKAI